MSAVSSAYDAINTARAYDAAYAAQQISQAQMALANTAYGGYMATAPMQQRLATAPMGLENDAVHAASVHRFAHPCDRPDATDRTPTLPGYCQL